MANTTEDDSIEDHPLFTPDLAYYTAPTHQSLDNTGTYYPRTITPYNRERQTILPVFPSQSTASSSSLIDNREEEQQVDLLLCNVPSKSNNFCFILFLCLEQELSQLQLARRAPDAYITSFDLIEHNLEMIDPVQDSFMLSIYRQLLYNLSLKWEVSIPILDHNLARLRQCAKKCLEQIQQQERQENLQFISSLPTTATFSIEELPLALEFYLQIDVDLFYMKTCSFHQAKPIEETIFCMKSPEIHYSLSACNKPHCNCCHPIYPRIYPGQIEAVQFNLKEKYQFLNGYQSILNCSAVNYPIFLYLFFMKNVL